MIKIETIENTVFKSSPIQSTQLDDSEKRPEQMGNEYEISSFTKVGTHFKFNLDDRNWYAYEEHVRIYENGKLVSSRLDFSLLKVPYKSQLDNKNNPTGTCNVTSIAMCLAFYGVEARYGQLEDELYEYAVAKGYNHKSPEDLAQIVREYGLQDTFKTNATIEEVKDWLATGKPAVFHGYFTDSGHIIVAVGFDKTGFFVHDPYGEWFSTGYRTDLSGECLHYSYRLIQETCIPDGNFWVHFISK